jgi:predicted phosphodiesterase
VVALLYDIHGNLPALEAVLEDAEREGVDRYLLGGDYASWIRGNGERWLREPPLDRPDVLEELQAADPGVGTDEGWLYSLQASVELDGVLYVHGSPLSDVDSFAPQPEDGEERLLLDVRDRTVVFGHSHQQFRRPGPNGTELLNPGSVGMPLDGDMRGAWAIRRDDGEFEFRRSAFDIERVAAAWRAQPGPWSEVAAQRIERGSD